MQMDKRVHQMNKVNSLIANLTVIWMALLLSACGNSAPPPIKTLRADSVILAFGDSLTHGTGAAKEKAYPAVLSRLLEGIQVVNAGIPGEVSEQGRARLPDLLQEHQPQVVILCHGGNDILRRQDRKVLENNLRSMLETIKQKGADIILLGVPQPSFSLSVPELYENLAEEFQIPYQGDILAEVLGDENFKSDTIHPNASGYQKIAQAVAELIRNAQQ